MSRGEWMNMLHKQLLQLKPEDFVVEPSVTPRQTLDPSGWKSRSKSETGSRHQADLDLKLDGSGSRSRMDGFRLTGLWCILIQEPQTQIQDLDLIWGGVDPTYNEWLGPLKHDRHKMDDIARIAKVLGARWDTRLDGMIGCRMFTAWPGDPSLLKTQDPAIGSGKHKKGRHAKARDTLQVNPGPDPDPEYWIHGPPDPSRRITESGHYTPSSVRIATQLAEIPQSRQDIDSSTLGPFTSYQRSKIQPYRRVEKVTKFSTDHGSSGAPSVRRCSDKVGKLDQAMSQILLIPLHHTLPSNLTIG
ncbi:unnamed protein product [Phytophthora fragariaefolia]|uniref:Unnamed protein product n=1 Tax=Phytophthora fragariaefolia TaxID=1490495 RepID=A0A9W7D0B9_9STRA|nr:unnamed protein product [Phytophthora fragariaefolia]